MAFRYLHYSREILTLKDLYTVSNVNRKGPKPGGLWISKEGPHDWEALSEKHNFDPEYLRYVHEVKFHAGHPILRIESRKALIEFSKTYRGETSYDIDWHKVSKKYMGIIIAPYQPNTSGFPELGWYYGWGCASGCIWNKFAFKAITHLRNFWSEKVAA